MQKITNKEIKTKLNSIMSGTNKEDIVLSKEDLTPLLEAQECDYVSLENRTFSQLQQELAKYKEVLTSAQTTLVVLKLSKDASFLDVAMLMDSINGMTDEEAESIFATKTTQASDTQSVELFEMFVRQV